MHRPPRPEYLELAKAHSLVPVYRQLVGDTLTPVTAFGKIQEGDWAFLFESVIGGERLGRYSFLGAGPFLRFQAFDHHVRIQSRTPGVEGKWPQGEVREHADPLRLLQDLLASYRVPHLPGLPRFC